MHALKKIQKSTLYQHFDQTLKDQMLAQPFAVALSGGVDSMALAMVAKTYAIEHDIDLHCLIVNHHLREESSAQIASLTAYLSTQNIQFQVLDWEHGSIQTAIQVKARKARYDLLKNYCEIHKISMLMTAHHLLDQIETYYLRQEKESGIVGLAGMNVVSYLGDIKLIRPFLELDKKELVKFCKAFEVPWWEDASNQDIKYRRNALRKTLTLEEISFAKGALLKAKLQKQMLYKEIILWVEKYIAMNHLGELSIQLAPDLLSQSDMSLYFWGLVLKLYS